MYHINLAINNSASRNNHNPAVLIDDIDLEEAGESHLTDRRTEIYDIITEPNPVQAFRQR